MITPSFGLTATERVLPRLALDFTTASLDSRVSFSRALATATRINASGLIEAVAADTPRFDYDPITLVCRGLLIEESRTNLLTYSQEMNNAAYGRAAITTSANALVSPDGTQNAEKFIAQNSATEHYVDLPAVSYTAGTTYTFSKYIKAAGLSWYRFRFSQAAFPSTALAWFDCTNGVVGTVGASATATITDAGNGWYRITVTATASGSGSFRSYFTISNADNTTVFTGNNVDGIGGYGIQIEAGAFATSYIPTTTTALTRNADVATMTGTNFSDWFNASEGTFVAQYIPKNPAPSNACGLFIADDGTGNNLVGVSVTSNLKGILSLATGGSGAGAIAANSGTVNQVNTVAGAYKVNDYAAALNAGTVATSTTLTLPNVTQARIGFLSRTGFYANATIQKLAFYPVRGINAQVQAQSK